jgi:hypothetical protein
MYVELDDANLNLFSSRTASLELFEVVQVSRKVSSNFGVKISERHERFVGHAALANSK